MTEGMGATPSDTVEHELAQIYAMDDGDEKHIDMSRLEIVRQPVVRRVLTATLLVLIAIMAGLLGALVLTNPLRSEKPAGPLPSTLRRRTRIVSGRPTTIRIPYQNTASVSLSSLEIEVHVPEMFVFQSAIPEPLKTAAHLERGVGGRARKARLPLGRFCGTARHRGHATSHHALRPLQLQFAV